DAPGALDFRAIDDFLAGVALDPLPLGDRDRVPGALVRLLSEPGHRYALRSGALSLAMKSPTSPTRDGNVARSSTRRTMAEPTITPSASRATAAAWSGRLMPN